MSNKKRNRKSKKIKYKSRSRRRQLPTKEGVMQKTKRGFGFVVFDDGGDDVYISIKNMNGAMNGDRVVVGMYPDVRRSDSPEGRVEKVLERATVEVVGTFEKNKAFGFVVPDDKKIRDEVFIEKRYFSGATKGDKVLAKIIKYPDKENSAEGKIVEIIGKAGEAGGDIRALIRSYGLKTEFPLKVMNEASKIPTEVSNDEIEGRFDLRDEKTFTIDGADAKDFDDAVSIKKLDNGNYLLGVHIADVSHYVKEAQPLDREALKRGTSVYLPDMVLPMLPETLSNGICSLKEGVDRLTLSVDMEIDKDGNCVADDVYESVIRSRHRLIYDDISDIYESDDEKQKKKYIDILDELLLMKELADILNHKRQKRGSIDFDLDEAVISLNDDGIPIDIAIADRRSANRLIEEFMLRANETIAERFCKAQIPFIYRVHEKPDLEKMMELRQFIKGFGLSLKGDMADVSPKQLDDILEKIKDTSEEGIITTVMLRSMKKAFYSPDCVGHFGLALKYYSHFTSPIRRYPDLMIHRIIKFYLKNEMERKDKKHFESKVKEASKLSSETEVKALELEREVEKLKKAEYMVYHIGDEFNAVISGVTSFGMFAELNNTIEGFISLNDLADDHYDYKQKDYSLVGRTTGNKYTLGDSIVIRVKDVKVEDREIDFLPIGSPK